mgnify:CR=1 FL=1
MSKRTQIVCIHEGTRSASIDPVFVNSFLKAYDPEWIRPWGTSKVRLVPCGGKTELLSAFPRELKSVLTMGADTTLVVFADIDDGLETGEDLKKKYWAIARENNIPSDTFEKVVFIFSKDRIENWIQFLQTGFTDENQEGPRVNDNSKVRESAQKLAEMCLSGNNKMTFPPSLSWSCNNWHKLINRMRKN